MSQPSRSANGDHAPALALVPAPSRTATLDARRPSDGHRRSARRAARPRLARTQGWVAAGPRRERHFGKLGKTVAGLLAVLVVVFLVGGGGYLASQTALLPRHQRSGHRRRLPRAPIRAAVRDPDV